MKAVERDCTAVFLREAAKARLEKEHVSARAALAETEKFCLKLKQEKRSRPRCSTRVVVMVMLWHHDKHVACFNDTLFFSCAQRAHIVRMPRFERFT